MENKIYKIVDLFGNEETMLVEKTKPNLFKGYDGFIDKFKIKKTTDDCYTPKEVYDLVLNYVGKNYDLTDKEIIRPFFPDGDYENIDYTKKCVVIDNPPFSMISKICRFYVENEIVFFLLAPHLRELRK